MKVCDNSKKATTSYCKICREENDVVTFKEHYICETCVAYIKDHF